MGHRHNQQKLALPGHGQTGQSPDCSRTGAVPFLDEDKGEPSHTKGSASAVMGPALSAAVIKDKARSRASV